MGIEDGGYDPNQYRVETEVKNRNAERSWSDKLLGRNKTKAPDVTLEESAYSPEDKNHAYARTYEVADRLSEAKAEHTTEGVIAEKRAVVEDELFDAEKSEAQIKARGDEIEATHMNKSKNEQLAIITEREEKLKIELEEAKKLAQNLPTMIMQAKESARMQPEKLQPEAYERVRQLEEQLQETRAIVSSREHQLAGDIPKQRENIETIFGSTTE